VTEVAATYEPSAEEVWERQEAPRAFLGEIVMAIVRRYCCYLLSVRSSWRLRLRAKPQRRWEADSPPEAGDSGRCSPFAREGVEDML
jgi:hypothetical protein